MSKPDSQFYRRFGLIVVVLTVCFVGLILLARGIAASSPTDDPQPAAADTAASTQAGSAPGAGAAAPAAQAQAQAATGAAPGAGSAQPETAANGASGEGATTYQQACSVCHGQGIAGAPKMGDKALWGPRIAQGKATLYDHALHGYNGKTGVMPAKAGRGDLSDAAVQAAVDYMVGQSGG